MGTTISDAYERIFKDKERIMAVFAHPDDLELYCGGTVARLIGDGKEVRSIKVTSGDMGSRKEKIGPEELRKLREKEDREAMKILGIKEENNIYLRFRDGLVENNLETIGKIAEQIRIFKPELVISHNPENKIIRFDRDINWVNHRDHWNTALSTLDAVFPYSRDLSFFPEHYDNNPGAAAGEVTELLLVDFYEHPDLVYIEMTGQLETRVQAHGRHESQGYGIEGARDSADFFTKLDIYPESKRYERFRYVVAD